MVTSVPSDAPDDYAALRDVKNKEVKLVIHIKKNSIILSKSLTKIA